MYIWYYITLLLCIMLLSYFVRNDEIKMFNQATYSRKTYNYAWHIDACNELGNWVITALNSGMLENILRYLS